MLESLTLSPTLNKSSIKKSFKHAMMKQGSSVRKLSGPCKETTDFFEMSEGNQCYHEGGGWGLGISIVSETRSL